MPGKISKKLKVNLADNMKIILTLILTFFIQHSYALSNKDVQLYKTIFNDYRNGDFKKGDESVAQLDDQILMGHVEALKLLHPTKHRSSFLELRDWLEKYNDQYEATRIYKLGVKRKPSGAANPKKNIYPELNEIFLKSSEAPKTISNLRKIFTSNNYSKKISIYNTVRSRVGRGWPTGALEYLSHHNKYFNDKEKSFLLSKIANGYYLSNLDDKAINVLNDASFINEPYSEGLWIKGLSFYRKGDFQTASRQFLILSKITSNKWLSDAGAYWSFLSSTKDANDNITFQASLDALDAACRSTRHARPRVCSMEACMEGPRFPSSARCARDACTRVAMRRGLTRGGSVGACAACAARQAEDAVAPWRDGRFSGSVPSQATASSRPTAAVSSSNR